MTSSAHIAAQMLKDARRVIAENVCVRLQSSDFHHGTDPRSSMLATCVEQTETHIHVLAACIEFSSPALLDDYVRWVSKLPKSLSPAQYEIAKFLEQLAGIVDVRFPSELATVVKNYVDRAMDSLRNETTEESSAIIRHQHRDLQRDYLAYLLAARRTEALRIVLQAVDSGVDIESIYLHVIQPTQQELGRLWQAGEISVAQEHHCTAATQFVMSQLQPYFLTNHSSGKTLVATCVGNELHEVGLRIVTDLFEVSGWNTIYLGANAPAESIAQTLVSHGAQLLAISTTMTQHLFELADVIAVVRSTPGCEHVKLLVGGFPFNVDPFLWKRVGADGHAIDAKEAIRIANQLGGSPAKRLGDTEAVSISPGLETSISSPTNESIDDLSRLNNSLITLQRELHKANVELTALNQANREKAEALQIADRRKDEFLAMLAHELRGPLAPMKLAVALLQMDDLSPSVIAEARETLKRQLHQMEHLISDLLDASRVTHGKIVLKYERLDLAAVVQRAIEIAHPLILDKKQELMLDMPGAAIALMGDEIRLTQVFANLLTNASKYTSEQGSIWLTTKRVRDTVAIEIRDNGVGIEPRLLPEMFSSFTQEQRSKQHSMGGLGLGLSLVKQLVELHQGTVMAVSEGAGLGSVFSVTLPALEPDESVQSVPAIREQESGATIQSRSVLIVEDIAGIARMTAILFEKLGHRPSIAIDGGTAITKFVDLRPEIVVLDLELPDMNGFDLTRQIRRLDPHHVALIVALTGHSDDEHRRLAEESGCDEYLVKPVDVRDLKALATHPKLMSATGS